MLKAVVATGLALACWTVSGFAGDPATTSRVIPYHASDVTSILTEIRYTTLVLLPPGEKVVIATVGDKDYWTVEASESVVLVKPGKAGVKTNINVVASSGNIYSFVVREVSQESDAHADLRVTITVADETMAQAVKGKPLFVSTEAVGDLQQRLEIAKKELQNQEAKHQTDLKRDKEQAQRDVASSIRHDYTWKQNKQAEDFGLKSIYSVNGFTYFEAHPQEAPAIYELRDGKDSLVEFSLDPDGKYVVPKIIKRGYLRVGKARLLFEERPNA